MKTLLAVLAVVSMLATVPWASLPERDSEQDPLVPEASKPHDIQVAPWGPSREAIEAARIRLLAHPSVGAVLAGTRHRLLSFELIDEADDTRPPERYRATLFDYTHNRAYVATGRIDRGGVRLARTSVQPEPSEAEFREALAILKQDREVGVAAAAGERTTYEPMPPLVDGSQPAEQVERTVAVGLAPLAAGDAHEIVGVNMVRRQVVRFAGGAPASALATAAACGLPNAGQSTTARGTAGSFNLVVSRGGVEIWRMNVTRPSASGGTRGSGVELRSVTYRGKRVLARASVPILNVQYEGNLCGPFRDWQWQENAFSAVGTNVASGIRRTTSPPATVLDSGNDTGNFRGVAIHDDGASVRLVAEMQAGWYRYISEWIFEDDGVIQPRFGFGGVNNTCVCNAHNHHAYWRLNFDVVGTANNTVCQSTVPGSCTDVATEARMATVGSYLEVRNVLGTEVYRLSPGPGDGTPDAYSKGSAWVLLYQNGQLDDGVNCTQGSSCPTSIGIDRFVNGQTTANRDVVVWYRASFLHHEDAAIGTTDHGGSVHVVGPELRPISW